MTIPITIPHADFGDRACCGCLSGQIQGEIAVISCDECGAVVRTVPSSDLQHTLDEIESTVDLAVERCQHCRAVNLIPGFERVVWFVGDRCGKANVVSAA